MPKNKGKGGKKKKRGTNQLLFEKKELVLIDQNDHDQVYGMIITRLGGKYASVYCNDDKLRVCYISGKIQRKKWFRKGSYVIISLRNELTPTEKTKGDIIHVYNEIDEKDLERRGIIKTLILKKNTVNESNDDLIMNLKDESDEEIEKVNVKFEENEESDSELDIEKI